MSAADRATVTRVLLDRGLEVSSRRGQGIAGERSMQPEAFASTIESQVNAVAPRSLEAMVPGHRLLTLHELHAVSEFLPLRRLWRLAGQEDSGTEPEQLQDRLPCLLARVP